MKRRLFIRSIYAKFVIIFISIWWLINSLAFSVIIYVISHSALWDLYSRRNLLRGEFHRIRSLTGLTFLISATIGSIFILLAVNGIVKPIRRLSKASKEVAKGNFDIEVKVKSPDEIGQLTSDFNLMTKELRNIDLLRKDFVSNVSHEFKTPITSIRGYAKLIRDGGYTEDQLKEYSEIIVNESERLSILSSTLLKISELDSKVIREQSTVFSLDEQIRKAILLLEVQWSKKNIDFELNLEEVMISVDKNLLHEVWLNLIHNAIKFSKQGGLITINLYKHDPIIIVEVKDQGVGIAPEDKDRIFERFYKGDRSRSKEGNGLGLVLVKKIIELSNGTISFKSDLGIGSTFVVELPITQ